MENDMALKGVFTLTGANEGKNIVLLERYKFVKGVMETSANDAPLIERLLCRFYGCTLEMVGVEEVEQDPSLGEGGSLLSSETKGAAGAAEAARVAAEAEAAKQAEEAEAAKQAAAAAQAEADKQAAEAEAAKQAAEAAKSGKK
jgi:pyruvate/2-oxoglutarate dehydrogenase complex dihydrolipoamide acyltransferase (E2) component